VGATVIPRFLLANMPLQPRNLLSRDIVLRTANWAVALVLIGAGLLKISAEFTTAFHFAFHPDFGQ
jgi:hypothetical protein